MRGPKLHQMRLRPASFPGQLKRNTATSGVDDFAALSYTWGEEKYPASIFLNGTRVLGTNNLEIFLRKLATNGDFEKGGIINNELTLFALIRTMRSSAQYRFGK